MLFAVTLGCGPAWDHAQGLREQAGWAEHAAYMDALTEEGFVVLGGPLGDATTALLIVSAASEEDIAARMASDPWIPMGIRQIAKVERWQILLRNVTAIDSVTAAG